jgi:hypothetical protein
VDDILIAIGTPSTTLLEDYMVYLERSMIFMDELLHFYGQKYYRRMKMHLYIKRQKAYSWIRNELTEKVRTAYPNANPSRTVIFWGNGEFSRGGYGHGVVPNKKLFTELKNSFRGRITPERYTSLVCSEDGSRTVGFNNLSIKKCNHHTCLVLWDRDINAARNIRDIGLYMNAHAGLRPWPFLPWPWEYGNPGPNHDNRFPRPPRQFP